MTKRVVHGLPISGIDPETGKPAIDSLSGGSFLATYYYTRPGQKKISDEQIDRAIELVGDDEVFFLDNGAFTAYRSGEPIHEDPDYIDGFYDWAESVMDRCPQAVAIVPDVIGGTAEQNWELASQLPWEPTRSCYVWHLHEPLEVLKCIIEEGYAYIGFGSSEEYWKVNSPIWQDRIDAAFAYLDELFADEDFAQTYVRPQIHMLRGISVQHAYRFDSADSVNLAINWNRQRKKSNEQLGAFRARVESKASQGDVFGDQAAWGTPADAGRYAGYRNAQLHLLAYQAELRTNDLTYIPPQFRRAA